LFDLSIIIPFYKGEPYINTLLKTLESSFFCSKRSIKVEIYIVLDSPGTNLDTLGNQLRNILTNNFFSIIRFYKNFKNLGASQSRNLGLSNSKSQYITFIDQDDCVEEDYFSVLEKSFLDKKDIDLFILNGSYKDKFSNKKIPIFFIRPNLTFKSIITQNRIKTPGLIVFKRKILFDHGCQFRDIDPYFKGCDDWYLLIDLFLKKPDLKYYFLNERIFTYIFHGQNYSNDLHKSTQGSILVLKHFMLDYPLYKRLFLKSIERIEFESVLYSRSCKFKIIYSDFKGFLLFFFVRITDINRLIFSFIRIINRIPFRV